jgi:hypothetical protein
MKALILLIGLAVLSVSLSAVLVTINPDEFAAGTDISTAFPYVTLSSGGGASGLDGKVYVAVRSASTGDMVFANSRTSSKLWLNQAVNGYYLRADFTIPTSYVSLDFIGDSSNDYPSLQCYNASGVLLNPTLDLSPLGVGSPSMRYFPRATADIAYILVGGRGTTSTNSVLLDNLKFEVPEPATCLILLSGWLLLKNRKKKLYPL